MDDVSEGRVIDSLGGEDAVIITALAPSRVVSRHPWRRLCPRWRTRENACGQNAASKNEHDFFQPSHVDTIQRLSLQFPCHAKQYEWKAELVRHVICTPCSYCGGCRDFVRMLRMIS